MDQVIEKLQHAFNVTSVSGEAPGAGEQVPRVLKRRQRRGQTKPVLRMQEHLLSGVFGVVDPLKPYMLPLQTPGGHSRPTAESEISGNGSLQSTGAITTGQLSSQPSELGV